MGDVARCLCPHGSDGKKCGSHAFCPIHGPADRDPKIPYELSLTDRKMLRLNKIDPEDSDAIQQVRQADEDRFRRD